MVNWRQVLPGFCATMMGIGFSRFSFTPLSALMVEKNHLTSQQITIIAAFMMAAYAIGAFAATGLAARVGTIKVIRGCLVAVAVLLIAEGAGATFTPVLVARFLMSVAGAMLMVLGPGLILSSLPSEQRGFAAGFVFTGIGVGILAAGSLVAILAGEPVLRVATALFAVALVVAMTGWGAWPADKAQRHRNDKAPACSYAFVGLLAAYTLDAFAFIPHTVYLSDFVSSELGQGARAGGSYWALFGVGGIVGAASSAWLRQKLDGQFSLELVMAVKALFIIVVGFVTDRYVIALSAFMVGALVPGIVMLVSTRTADIVGSHNMTKAWGVMTGAFAIGQFAGATGMSLAYFNFGKYQPLFTIGGIAEALGLVALVISIRMLTPQPKGKPE